MIEPTDLPIEKSDPRQVVPVDFMRLPLIAVIGAASHAEVLDPTVILGTAMIFAGT